jgi:hypothetical protein
MIKSISYNLFSALRFAKELSRKESLKRRRQLFLGSYKQTPLLVSNDYLKALKNVYSNFKTIPFGAVRIMVEYTC